MNYFDRAPTVWRPMLEDALRLLPNHITRPRFLIGVSPRFVGLHSFSLAETWPDVAADGWTYDDVAHACASENVPDRVPTVVIPKPHLYATDDQVRTVLHEIGHLVHFSTGFDQPIPATTAYSRSNELEAFAEAFSLILDPPTAEWDQKMRGEEFAHLRELMGVAA